MAHPERDRELQGAVAETDSDVREGLAHEGVELGRTVLSETRCFDAAGVREREERIRFMRDLERTREEPLAQDGLSGIGAEPAAAGHEEVVGLAKRPAVVRVEIRERLEAALLGYVKLPFERNVSKVSTVSPASTWLRSPVWGSTA